MSLKPERALWMLLAASLALAAPLLLADERGWAHEGFLVTPQNSQLYAKLPEYENQLYGHAYANQAVSQRITRLEKTLFGAVQGGPMEVRFAHIDGKMKDRTKAAIQAEQEPMLAYLEQKLFQRTYENKSLPERLDQLETHVFGKSFREYPISVRLKKLTYAMPLVAKEIRLSNKNGMVIASTNRFTPHENRGRNPEPDMILLDGSSGGKVDPNGRPLSSGDYFQGIYRQGTDRVLRWNKLPIRIYTRPGTPMETITNNRAIAAWKNSFSIEIVSTSAQADVIIDWVQAPSTPATRPILHMNDQNAIRTAVMITMGGFKTLDTNSQLHALTHQLGHAFGIWGHSDDPNDIMYPHLGLEASDIPSRWAARSSYVTTRMHAMGEAPPSLQPSQRDINTLLRVYDQPAQDLSMYNSY